MNWYIPAGTQATTDGPLKITPEAAGWAYSGMNVIDFDVSPTVEIVLSDDEAVIVPLSAQNFTVTVNGTEYPMQGRAGVFAAVADWLYAPVGSTVTLAGSQGEVAICTARATEIFPVHYTPAKDVPVESRGAGLASRQVNNIATPDSFHDAHKINVCEVLTPGGNWSSWPPHRHDGMTDCPVTNEEIYYFRMGRGSSPHGDPAGEGLFHVYTVSGSVDETVTVKDGDAYLVPEGYHGPTVAPPEYPMYFLNVLAGPADDRTMAFCDDPEHHWIRDAWQTQEQDPRLPMTSASGRVN